MTRGTRPSRLTKALLETAEDMRRVGILDAASHGKITLRHLGDKAAPVAESVGREAAEALYNDETTASNSQLAGRRYRHYGKSALRPGSARVP